MTEPNLYAIPPELRQLPQWVLYRIQTRNDRTTKIPYQAAHPRKRASTTDPATWGTFQTAAEAHARGRGDGIGFVFTPDDPYIGIDLDQCLHNGVLKPEAAPDRQTPLVLHRTITRAATDCTSSAAAT
jgi:putative DNA primase/helicase